MDLKRHRLSALFGDMDAEAREELKTDIDANGLNDPTIWTLDGQVLDGWHRYSIAHELGIEGDLVLENREDDGVGFVLGQNLHRRHLDAGQRAAIVVAVSDYKEASGRRADGEETTTVGEMAETADVSTQTIHRTKKAMEAHPEKTEALISGEENASKILKRDKALEKIVEGIVDEIYNDYRLSGLGNNPKGWWCESNKALMVSNRLADDDAELTEEEQHEMHDSIFEAFMNKAEAWDALTDDEKAAASDDADTDADDDVSGATDDADTDTDESDDPTEEAGATDDADDEPISEIIPHHGVAAEDINTIGEAITWLGDCYDILEQASAFSELDTESHDPSERAKGRCYQDALHAIKALRDALED